MMLKIRQAVNMSEMRQIKNWLIQFILNFKSLTFVESVVEDI